MSPIEKSRASHILLFDGYCILCSKFAKRLIKRLGNEVLVIPMQSEAGQYLLEKHQQATLPNEVVFITNERLTKGMSAVLLLMEMSGGNWRFAKRMLNLLPLSILKWFYRKIAENRFIWFGKRRTCYLGNS